MKAPYCAICHKRVFPGGGEVHFLDYVPLPPNTCGDPPGHQYFCGEHLSVATGYRSLKVLEALELLAKRFGEFPPFEAVNGPFESLDDLVNRSAAEWRKNDNDSCVRENYEKLIDEGTNGVAADSNENQSDLFE